MPHYTSIDTYVRKLQFAPESGLEYEDAKDIMGAFYLWCQTANLDSLKLKSELIDIIKLDNILDSKNIQDMEHFMIYLRHPT